jgi:hypothetical protein
LRISLEEKASKRSGRRNTPQIPLTYRSNPSIHRAESISPSLPAFPFLPSLAAQRQEAAAGRCLCLPLRWILRPLAVCWSGDPAARASAGFLFCWSRKLASCHVVTYGLPYSEGSSLCAHRPLASQSMGGRMHCPGSFHGGCLLCCCMAYNPE